MIKCPGQDQRFWKPEDIFEIKCTSCGESMEFFKDDPKLKCRSCGHVVPNPRIDLGCAEWCKFADKCMAVSASQDASAIREDLIEKMKHVFGDDNKRIDHALAVLDYAEQILAVQGGDPLVVKAAAILHDIGIPQAQAKHNSCTGKYQELEGPPIAAKILIDCNVHPEIIDHVCKIIANHHSAKDIDTNEFRIVWDSDWLVNTEAVASDMSKERLTAFVDSTFRTEKGKQLAIEKYL